MASARSAGTRQQVRAAARRFVRRHRRDASYLRWVVRSVGASSALAMALLGLSATPAGAELPPFAAQTGAANPLAGQDLGSDSTAALGDLDGDGDLDLVAGEFDGVFNYFENTSSAASPAFLHRTGTANPLNGQDVGGDSAPSLGDLDSDGDLDLVAGEFDGVFNYFENTGSAESPAFLARTGAANPLSGQDVGILSAPSLGDLDGDGDLDLVVGEQNGGFRYYENTGSATSPAFVAGTGTANPLNGQNVGFYSVPTVGDLDGDSDLDLLAGESASGAFFLFENTGSATSPAFAARTGAANPLHGQSVGFRSTPSLGDLDGDSDPDLVVGESEGVLNYFEHLGGRLVPRTGATNPLDGTDVGGESHSALGDLDADGDLDLVAGESDGVFNYFENTGSATNSVFISRTGLANPLDGQEVVTCSTPSFGDLDGDSDLDLVSGDCSYASGGLFFYFENTGSVIAPAFLARTGAANPLAGQDVFIRSTPSLGDLDGDGDLDVVAGSGDGIFFYFENTGSATSPGFVSRTGAANPLDGQTVGLSSRPSLGDLDGDGDLDVVAGGQYGTLFYFENTGSAIAPAFVARTSTTNPLAGHDVGSFSAASLGDLDGDADLDLVAGNSLGVFFYFESFVVQTPPARELTGAANPLAGQDVGSRAGAALADLDRDGDADLVAGENFGAFLFFENTGSPTAPAFLGGPAPQTRSTAATWATKPSRCSAM